MNEAKTECLSGQEVKIGWEVLNRKVKKLFLNAVATRHNKKYHEVAEFFSKAQPVMVVEIKDKKAFCKICPSSNKLIVPVIDKYLNEPNSKINKIISALEYR